MQYPFSDSNIVHIEQFADAAPNEIALWLEENGKTILNDLNSRISWLFENQEYDKSNVPPTILNFRVYCKSLPVFTRMQIRKATKKLTPLMMVTALAKYAFHTSYHQLFWGCEYPTRLSGQAAAFVHYFSYLLPNEKQEIVEILKKHREEITYIPRVLLDRLNELAEARSVFTRKISPVAQFSRSSRALYISFLESEIPADIDNLPAELPRWHSNLSPIYCMLSASMFCQVSCDYFLLQDYSSLAVHEDGTELTEQEREALSHFLMATTEGKAKAFRYFF